jgi:diadenosine tetraphosphatase ApaH/serine/threonine PP2A family protein phosphatase
VRYLVISDIHGNLPALAAVLRDCPPDQYDRLLVLGDLVGYGAEPGAVIDRIRALAPHVVVRGNHDKAICGVMDLLAFNSHAREAAEWTTRALSPAHLAYLRDLPAGPLLVDDVLEVWHGSPADEDAYLVWIDDIRDAAALGRRPLCLFGHTHVQGAYGSGEGHPVVESGDTWTRTTLSIRLEDRWLVNPGSVGQPRDGDPRAAYAMVDLGARTITLHRVQYDVAAEQAAIRAAGLPELLASRLSEGR